MFLLEFLRNFESRSKKLSDGNEQEIEHRRDAWRAKR